MLAKKWERVANTWFTSAYLLGISFYRAFDYSILLPCLKKPPEPHWPSGVLLSVWPGGVSHSVFPTGFASGGGANSAFLTFALRHFACIALHPGTPPRGPFPTGSARGFLTERPAPHGNAAPGVKSPARAPVQTALPDPSVWETGRAVYDRMGAGRSPPDGSRTSHAGIQRPKAYSFFYGQSLGCGLFRGALLPCRAFHPFFFVWSIWALFGLGGVRAAWRRSGRSRLGGRSGRSGGRGGNPQNGDQGNMKHQGILLGIYFLLPYMICTMGISAKRPVPGIAAARQ